MIDGESSKAELLQYLFIWRYYYSYSDVYFIKMSKDLTEKRHVKLQLKEDFCIITLKTFDLIKELSIGDRRHGVDRVRQV